MSRAARSLRFLFVALAVLTPSRNAEAQPGAIKKKVKAAVIDREQPKPDPEAAKLTAAMQAGEPISITEEVIEDFKTGLGVEVGLLQAFQRLVDTYKTQEQYRACKQQAAGSPEGHKILLMMYGVPEGAPLEAMQGVMEKMQSEMKALVLRKCGTDFDEDWPQQKRSARLAEIERAGADAFDAAQAARTARPRGPHAREDSWESTPAYSDIYFLLKDKILPFCKAKDQGIIIRDTDGLIKFSHSSSHPLSLLYTQSEALAQWNFCQKDVGNFYLAYDYLYGVNGKVARRCWSPGC